MKLGCDWSGMNHSSGIAVASETDKSFDPESVHSINQTLTDVLMSGDALMNRLLAKLESLDGHAQTALFVTDLEALH